jgi:ribosome-binding factor A
MLELEKIASKKSAPLRQLRVAESIKKVISEIFSQKRIDAKIIVDSFITVSRVKVSPDLKNASVYISVFQASNADELITQLNRLSSKFRAMLNQEMKLRYSPQILFRHDDTLEEVSRIQELIDTTE